MQRGVIYNEKESQIVELGLKGQGMSMAKARFFAQWYKQIEEALGKEMSYVVEFGYDFGEESFMIYQAKPFKPIQTASFNLPSVNKKEAIYSPFALGITPEEGIVLPAVKGIGFHEAASRVSALLRRDTPLAFDGSLESKLNKKLFEAGIVSVGEHSETRKRIIGRTLANVYSEFDARTNLPYALLFNSMGNENFALDLSVPHMQALVHTKPNDFLVHDLTRLFKHAEVVIGYPTLSLHSLYESIKSLEERVRIISNGREAVVMRE